MLENETPVLWSLYQPYQRKARHLRSLVFTAHLRNAARAIAGWLRAFDRAAGRPVERLRARRNTRKAVQALQRLDDRMLGDIGVFRGEINHVVRHGRTKVRANVVAMPDAPRPVQELKQAA
jgi:uncharacterized protein YjiS (DUF1127 family)